ncbi:UDP-2,4-diacetamido-2,4,6-trideoxy-beta-L-altropyranose hydrolase [Pseudoalteromonas sp. S3776]|uniref:UDP-2,4-diacetamido-2,4, 6-trideoxy-beta-L-altropyranose hydrolase n=1 Tax=Pseudoalteromonas sp. S3776 TaxID=579544 RepID=UPI001108F8ED|nr:UDP-2,4-diacetamido-2,4,6-trideoxy-beta-L-altropyranose hydrolase [Pseudoalteromonas sp. S3776]TMO76932.1 UDP-2,4-diacetamido-2,4,6-trideoxy-beta-L-altropyranose hydrolase [Pseudoalteromonas sp. S3776]
MEVVIRSDASSYIGSGHIMRCLVLADRLKLDGHEVTFATRPQSGDLVSLIKQRGFSVYALQQPTDWVVPSAPADYAAWLQVSELEDARQFVSASYKPDLVITDHYAIGAKWHEIVKKSYHCKIVAIDDLVRAHNAELIIDQTLLRESSEYSDLNPKTKALTGTEYAIVNPLFSKHHKSQLMLDTKLANKPRVLISMGGVDAPNATEQVLAVLRQSISPPKTTVLLSPRAPHYNNVKKFAEENSTWVTHVDFVDDMADLMCKHDIAIGAPGSTSWERACVGLPSIVIGLADNQQTICKNLDAVGAAISVELNTINKNLMNAYKQLIKNYSEMRSINLNLCDGKGVERIIKQVNKLFNNTLNLRFATLKDVEQVYNWQCEPETRRYALNKNVPSLAEHTAWMSRKLESKNDYFYIIELAASKCEKKTSVGVVRLDQSGEETYTISIFIAPEHFGKGIAKYALKQIDILHAKEFINAVVLKENTASQTLFSRAGYTRINEEQFTRLPVE